MTVGGGVGGLNALTGECWRVWDIHLPTRFVLSSRRSVSLGVRSSDIKRNVSTIAHSHLLTSQSNEYEPEKSWVTYTSVD